MNLPQKVYIALGSNEGDKFKYLQDAIDCIHYRIGNIISISRVFKSSALGFEGSDFFNVCIAIETLLKPEILLKELLSIETFLGRVRTKKEVYQNRTIDLDIIFFEDEVINTKTLQIPHPEMSKRRFVLQPLSHIASSLKHPKLEKEVSVLLEECDDETV